MATAYSLDLREKILTAWQNQEGSQRQIAERFKVSLTFVYNLLKRYRETGEIAPRPQGGDRRSKLKGENEHLLEELVKEKKDIYLGELKEKIFERTGIQVSESSLCRYMQKLKLRRKKTVAVLREC